MDVSKWRSQAPLIDHDIDSDDLIDLLGLVLDRGLAKRLPLDLARFAYRRLDTAAEEPVMYEDSSVIGYTSKSAQHPMILYYYPEDFAPHLIWIVITESYTLETYTARVGRGEGEIDTLDTAKGYLAEQAPLQDQSPLTVLAPPLIREWYAFASESQTNKRTTLSKNKKKVLELERSRYDIFKDMIKTIRKWRDSETVGLAGWREWERVKREFG